MKTKIIILLSLTVCALFLIGCDANEPLKKTAKQTPIAVSAFVFDQQETINTINAQKNLKASKDIIFDVPEDVSSIGEFKYDILPQASFKDFEEDFLDLFEFIFPESIMNKDEKTYLYVDTTPQIEGTPVLSVEEHRNELLNGERQFLLLYYDEFTGNDFKYEEGQVMLQATTPMGCEMVRFNRGKIRKYLMDLTAEYADDNNEATVPYMGVMEGFDISMMFSEIATHSPDSQQSYKLIDREVKICDAVKIYTEYVNSLPFMHDKDIGYTVSQVEVYRLDDSTYCYRMIATLTYKGIPFNRGETGIFGDTYNQKGEIINTPYNVFLSGIVAYSNEVDSIEGFPVSHTVSDYRKYDKLLSADSAVKTISSYMSEEIEFEVLSLELLYSGDFPEGNDFYNLRAVWKMILRNHNDGKDYYCYIDAETGDNFCYTAIPYKTEY